MPWPIPAGTGRPLLDGSQANYELKQKKSKGVYERGDLPLVRVLTMNKNLCFSQTVSSKVVSFFSLPPPSPFEGLAAVCA